MTSVEGISRLARRINCRAVSPARAGDSPSPSLICSLLLTTCPLRTLQTIEALKTRPGIL